MDAVKQRVFSGVQPSGNIHLGNYLGAIRNWKSLQEIHECRFCVVDLHALTVMPKPQELRDAVRHTAAAFIASGIAAENIVIQSFNPHHASLAWVLSCVAKTGWLDRMTQFKDKAGVSDFSRSRQEVRDAIGVGLYTYPVLMAADILLHRANLVPVGEDQRQHLQLARQIAMSFNSHYGAIFTVPDELVMGEAKRVMSLRHPTNKMSKSSPSDQDRINLTDTADMIVQKIKRAVTDADLIPADAASLEGRAGAQNLLRIYAALTGTSLEESCSTFAGQGFSIVKRELADRLVAEIVPVGDAMNDVLTNWQDYRNVISMNNLTALMSTQEMLDQVYEVVGLC